jgi:hypothetical protein
MVTTNKEAVLNTITLFNTVGQELEDILNAQGKEKTVLLKYLGWENKSLSSIKRFSKKDITAIESFFGVDGLGDYLRNFQEDYKNTLEKAKASYRENKKLYTRLKGVLPLLNDEFTRGVDVLEDISDFFGVDDESQIPEKANDIVALYRISGFPIDQLNLYAWMRRGELDFHKLNLPEYNRVEFERWINSNVWVDHLTDAHYLESLPEMFMQFGVGLVFTHFLPKTVFGCVRWINNKPLIQISDREKSLAVFWATLFHEIGHVLLHEHDDIFEGSINETKTNANKKEKEANTFAYGKIYNGYELRKFIFSQKNKWVQDDFIHETSERFAVNKMFVAYWMKKAQVNNRLINSFIPSVDFSYKSQKGGYQCLPKEQ